LILDQIFKLSEIFTPHGSLFDRFRLDNYRDISVKWKTDFGNEVKSDFGFGRTMDSIETKFNEVRVQLKYSSLETI